MSSVSTSSRSLRLAPIATLALNLSEMARFKIQDKRGNKRQIYNGMSRIFATFWSVPPCPTPFAQNCGAEDPAATGCAHAPGFASLRAKLPKLAEPNGGLGPVAGRKPGHGRTLLPLLMSLPLGILGQVT